MNRGPEDDTDPYLNLADLFNETCWGDGESTD